MNVLVPDHVAFRGLSFPGVTLTPYRAGHPLSRDTEGAVLWGFPRGLRSELFALPQLKWVLTLTAGVDHLIADVPPHVTLYNASRLHDDAVAQHAAAMLLTAARGLHRARDLQREGRWGRLDGLWSLRGRHVVVWGYGHIGARLEEMLAPFGARVTGLRSRSTDAEIDAALAEADDVVLLLPATEKTRGIVNAERLARVRAGAWLMNLGRGSLVVQDDLVAALRAGTLGGALLDVTDPEPLPQDSPLWSMENVVITPHVASATTDVLDRAADFARAFLADLTAGRDPGGRVDTGRGY